MKYYIFGQVIDNDDEGLFLQLASPYDQIYANKKQVQEALDDAVIDQVIDDQWLGSSRWPERDEWVKGIKVFEVKETNILDKSFSDMYQQKMVPYRERRLKQETDAKAAKDLLDEREAQKHYENLKAEYLKLKQKYEPENQTLKGD